MASEGSVAPKERVNIVYRPAIGDAKAEVELPLKLLVVGDYTLRQDDTPIEEMKPVSIDKDNFNEVLKAQKLSLDLTVPNKLDEKADPDAVLAVNMKFDNINDFTPDAIVDKVPELRQMIALRDALKALKGPLGNIPDFRKKVQELVEDEGVRARLLGEFAMELRDRRRLRLAGRTLEAARMLDRLVPVALMLVDADQVPQRGRRERIHRDEVGEQRFRAVEQAGAHVVLAEFEHGDGLFVVAEIRTRDEVLVHADRAIDLAATAEQVAEREMRFDGVAVDFGELEEDFDRLVLLLVEQVVEAAEVVRRQLAHARAGGAFAAAPAEHPTRERRDRQQQEQQRQPTVHGAP